MAWVGQKLVLCTSLRYVLLQPAQGTSTQLFALAEEAPSPTLVQSIPSANLAVLLMVSTSLCRSPCASTDAFCLLCYHCNQLPFLGFVVRAQVNLKARMLGQLALGVWKALGV